LNYIPTIYQVFSEYDLPPHFFYLALQESDFNVNACGPQTDSGIAKGAWQFIPSTAANYGLRVGPLQHLRQPDPRDERHHFEKSTRAAARYIKDIYDTDAQASGLLVMASYNWGENRVLRLLQRMPENPRERNLWRLLALYRNQIPKETYDYVFSIISAAVIGENPALFGFDFENPLASAEKSS
jgi:soluble lytic murein transglycosylase-like protein